jgi:hypothetical protein
MTYWILNIKFNKFYKNADWISWLTSSTIHATLVWMKQTNRSYTTRKASGMGPNNRFKLGL